MKSYSPKCLILFQFIVAIVSSVGYPALGYFIGHLLFCLMKDPDSANWASDKDYWSFALLMLCFAIGFLSFLQKLIFYCTSENLVLDLRCQLFESLMYKHVTWFDKEDRSPEAIANIVSEDVSNLSGLTTELHSQILETVLSIASGVALAVLCEWHTTLVCLGCIPFLILGGFLMSKLRNRHDMND